MGPGALSFVVRASHIVSYRHLIQMHVQMLASLNGAQKDLGKQLYEANTTRAWVGMGHGMVLALASGMHTSTNTPPSRSYLTRTVRGARFCSWPGLLINHSTLNKICTRSARERLLCSPRRRVEGRGEFSRAVSSLERGPGL